MAVKPQVTSKFESFCKSYYPEHVKKIRKTRKLAKNVKYIYPGIGFLVPLVIFGAIGLGISIIRNMVASQMQLNVENSPVFQENSMDVLISAVIGIGFFSAVISAGICFGVSLLKAEKLKLEAEEYEMNLRMAWANQKIQISLEQSSNTNPP